MLQRNPAVAAPDVDLEPRAHAGVGVLQPLEGLSVDAAANGLGLRLGSRKRARAEHLTALGLGLENALIGDDSGRGFGVASYQHVELLAGALVIAREAEQLEEEGPADRVGAWLCSGRS